MMKKYQDNITPYQLITLVKDTKIKEKKSVANKLAETFLEKSLQQKILNQKKDKEKYKINLDTKDQEKYDQTFSITELKDSIEK